MLPKSELKVLIVKAISFCFITSLALVGCKVKVQVPEGGVVTSSSGLYSCTSGEICTIEIDHPYLLDTFTAVPEDGFEFAGWERVDGGFCGGSNAPCSLSTIQFPLYPALMGMLDSSEVFVMNPLFTKNGALTKAADSIWTVESKHHVINYMARGDTVDEVRDSKEGEDNPLEYRDELGFKPDGLSQLKFNYEYTWRSSDRNISCRVVSGVIKLEFITTIPQLLDFPEKSDYLRSKWEAYQEGLVEHEVGHQEINRRLATELSTALLQVGKQKCNELAGVLNNAATSVSAAIGRANKDFDAETNYGRYTIPQF
jgi:predicted secreted Zn-dependent protease